MTVVPRVPRRGRGFLALALVGSLGGLAGCSNDNAILTGPSPAGVTTGATTGGGGPNPSRPSSSATTAPGAGADPADVLVGLELKVRQSLGGCWQAFAPGGSAAATRQDLWFSSTAACQGTGWSIALQEFSSNEGLSAAAQRAATPDSLLQHGDVLIELAPTASAQVRELLAAQPGVTPLPAS